jgi:hypothetical protein
MHDNNRAHMQTLKLQQLLNQMRILLLWGGNIIVTYEQLNCAYAKH